MIRRWDKSRPPSGPFALNRDCPQAQGLVAWWPLGGASGKVFVPDLSGKHHLAPGTAPGSVTLGNDGRPALSFVAASSQYLTVGTAPVDAVPLTLTAWGKADSSTQTPIYIGGVANDNFFRIVLVSGKVRANCGTLTGPTQANAITSASYTTGAWQLFGATFASTSSRTVYLNGGNSVNETTSISPTAVNTRVFVGTGITVADAILQPWNGDLGETGVWNVALSADMHARLYNEGTRFELWYPLRSRKWMVPAGGGSVSLIVADATHAHTADGLVLTSSTALSVAEATHAHAADAITLVVGSVLTVAEAGHAHAADNLALTVAAALAVADAAHGHAADGLTLTSAHALIVAGATHAHAADNLTLTAASVLALQEALHAHAADATALTMDSALAVAETLHAQAADNLVLGVAGTTNLVVADAAHAHSADVLALTSAHALVVADAIHGHSVEGLTLSVASVLAIQEALHAHAAENLALETTGSAVLLLADSLHVHTSDGAALTVDAWLVAADAAHGHSADNVVFTFGGAIPTDTLPMMVPLQNSYMLVAPERSLMIVRV